MKIFNTQVYGLHESLTRSGYPMSTDVKAFSDIEPSQAYVDGYKRGLKLGNAKPGSGHDCFLKGIIVQADIEAPSYWWPQWQRYHFADIISSQSKMHKMKDFNVSDKTCEFVDNNVIEMAQTKVLKYNMIDKPTREDLEWLIANMPQGLELTAGITTNYLQLKTMYNQRHNHRLKMWNKVFKEWAEGLPMFKELCLGGNTSE